MAEGCALPYKASGLSSMRDHLCNERPSHYREMISLQGLSNPSLRSTCLTLKCKRLQPYAKALNLSTCNWPSVKETCLAS